MPVQFICPECRRTLSVTRRKIGQQVICPKCSSAVTVPTSQPALVATPGASQLAGDLDALGIVGLTDFEELSDLPLGKPLPPAIPPKAIPSSGVHSIVPGRVAVSRTAIYLQSVLLLLIAAVFFGLGYWLGGVDARRIAETPAAQE